MEMKFYRCKRCGQMVAALKKTGCPVVCCGEPMEEIIPGTSDGAVEKHVPVYEVKDGKVTVCVGSVAHPMLEEHYIEWIALQTNNGNQRKALKPGDEPKAEFALLEGDEVQAVYAYCNLHSLFKG
jgi:superoxide reductase